MKAKDLMVPLADFLTPGDTLQRAVEKMRAAKRWHGQGVKGMVVQDEGGTLVGILSIKDILRATIPTYLDPALARFSWDGMLEEMARRAACARVRDFMTAAVITVGEETPLMACVDLLIQNKLQRLPVVDAAGRVVGVVYIRDIYNLISQIFLDQPECPL